MPDKSNEIMIEEVTEALSQIKRKYNIDDERFISGYIFVRGILDGMTTNSAYAEAFEVTHHQARNLSSQLYRTKWIQAIIAELEIDTEARDREYIQEAKETLSVAMSTEGVEMKDRIAAARGMGSIIKDTKKQDREDERSGGSKIEEMLKQIKDAAMNGKIISPSSGVIDVQAIEE